MKTLNKICLVVILILSNIFPTLETPCANIFDNMSNNVSNISLHVTEVLSNGISVELFIENSVPRTFLTSFKPESLKTRVQNSTLLVNYDARISENMLLGMISIDVVSEDFQDWLTYLQPIILLAAGLMLLAFEAAFSHARDKDILKIIEAGGAPPKGSLLTEKSLLLLSSSNPEAYRRALNMVLKGELRVKKGRVDRLGNAFSRLKKFVNHRRRLLL